MVMQRFKCMTYDKKISLFILTSRVKTNFKNPPIRRQKEAPCKGKRRGEVSVEICNGESKN